MSTLQRSDHFHMLQSTHDPQASLTAVQECSECTGSLLAPALAGNAGSGSTSRALPLEQILGMPDLATRDALSDEPEKSQAPEQSEAACRETLFSQTGNDADSIKAKEEAIQRIADLKVEQKDAAGLRQLLTDLRPLFGTFPKAKTAKIVRHLIDAIAKIPGSTPLQVKLALCTPNSSFCVSTLVCHPIFS